MERNIIIKIKLLNKSYGERIIFNDFNLKINEGEIIAITGSSGSGKSTLLNILSSLEFYQSGDVFVDGLNIAKLSKKQQILYLRNTISLVFQNYALMEDRSVYDNINLGNVNSEDNRDQCMKALVLVGLKDFENRKIITLSGGEQQRVALSRAFIKTSKVILADEPTGNLDMKNTNEIIDIFKKLKEDGKTVLVVTHDNSILNHFDRVINLDEF